MIIPSSSSGFFRFGPGGLRIVAPIRRGADGKLTVIPGGGGGGGGVTPEPEPSIACYANVPTDLIEGTTAPYADMATAAAKLSISAMAGCLAWGEDLAGYPNSTRTLFDSDFTGGVFAISSNVTDTGGGSNARVSDQCVARIYLTTAGGLSCDYTLSTSGPGTSVIVFHYLSLFEDDQATTVDSVSGSTSGTFAPSIPADGYYWIYASNSELYDTVGTAYSAISLSCTGGASLAPCTIRALYGGTPDYLVCT